MTSINGGSPVTANADIAKVSNASSQTSNNAQAVDKASGAVTAAQVNREFISAAQDQRAISQPSPDIPTDVIRVSSSIGQADIRSNLSRTQATEIYQKISKLI